jgi:hypothetical protein
VHAPATARAEPITASDLGPEANAIGSYYDTTAAIGAAVRNGALVGTTAASGRGPADEVAGPLYACSERDILDLIGGAIGHRYPVGSASLWHRRAGSVGEKRIAECVAGVVFGAAGDDPLARRVAVAASEYAAARPPAPLRELIAVAIGRAILEIDAEITAVVGRLAAIRSTRSRASLAEVARQRAVILPDLRRLDRKIAALRRDIALGQSGADGGAGRRAAGWCRRRDLPRLEARAAKLRGSLPSYRLPAAKRRRLAEFDGRLRRLRAAQRALRRAARDIERANGRPVPASGIGAGARGG